MARIRRNKFGRFGAAMGKHSAEIYAFLGISGLISAGVWAVTATPKALDLIEKKKQELEKEKLTTLETVQAAWKPYAGPAVMAAASAVCIASGQNQVLKKNAALAAAYKLSETALSDYKETVANTVDEKQRREIAQNYAQKRLEAETPPVNIMRIGDGKTYCHDNTFGGYFYANRDQIKDAFDRFNEELEDDGYASLNSLRYEIGLEKLGSGDDFGYDFEDGKVIPEFTSHLSPEGIPCLAFDYRLPKSKFDMYDC